MHRAGSAIQRGTGLCSACKDSRGGWNAEQSPTLIPMLFPFLLWCLLLVLCWPIALLALILFPLVWLVLLPLRLVGIAVGGVFDLLRAILRLPLRLLGGPSSVQRKSP